MLTALIMTLQYICLSLLVMVISSINCEFIKIATWNATGIVSSAPYLSRHLTLFVIIIVLTLKVTLTLMYAVTERSAKVACASFGKKNLKTELQF